MSTQKPCPTWRQYQGFLLQKYTKDSTEKGVPRPLPLCRACGHGGCGGHQGGAEGAGRELYCAHCRAAQIRRRRQPRGRFGQPAPAREDRSAGARSAGRWRARVCARGRRSPRPISSYRTAHPCLARLTPTASRWTSELFSPPALPHPRARRSRCRAATCTGRRSCVQRWWRCATTRRTTRV